MDEMTEVNAKRENLRLGIITLHNDPVPEMEIWKMCRVGEHFPHISIHTMRFFLPKLAFYGLLCNVLHHRKTWIKE